MISRTGACLGLAALSFAFPACGRSDEGRVGDSLEVLTLRQATAEVEGLIEALRERPQAIGEEVGTMLQDVQAKIEKTIDECNEKGRKAEREANRILKLAKSLQDKIREAQKDLDRSAETAKSIDDRLSGKSK